MDGTRTLTLEEFDRLAEEGSDEIDRFFDWSKAYRQGEAPGSARVSLDVPLAVLDRIHAEADRRGLSRDALLAEWVLERVDRLGAPTAHDHAAE